MLLALDTATQLISVALHDGERLLAEQTWLAGRRHSEALAPTIQAVAASVGVALADLTGVAASVGPGSYTGLRIGVALAKGLAGARDLPLVGASTLETTVRALPGHPGSGPLTAVVPAGRGRVIAQTFGWQGDAWIALGEMALQAWDALLLDAPAGATLTGEIDRHGLAAIREASSDERPLHIAPPAARLRRAGYLAEIAWERLRSPEHAAGGFHADYLVPIYVQTSPAPTSEPTRSDGEVS